MRPCVKRAAAPKLSANDSIRLLSVLEAPVMYANVNLGCAIFQRGSRPTRRLRANPNRVRSFCSLERFARSWPPTDLSHGIGFEPLALQAPFLLRCCLPGSRSATSVTVRTRGVAGQLGGVLAVRPSCSVVQAGTFSLFASPTRFLAPRRAVAERARL